LGAKSSVTTSRLAVEFSARGRDKPVMRNLPEVTSRTSSSGISSSNTLTEEGVKYLAL
jgi:hypothetical protein